MPWRVTDLLKATRSAGSRVRTGAEPLVPSPPAPALDRERGPQGGSPRVRAPQESFPGLPAPSVDMCLCQYNSEKANGGTEAERQAGKNERREDLGFRVMRNTREKERRSKEPGARCLVLETGAPGKPSGSHIRLGHH